MAMIIADERWLKLIQPSNDWSVGFIISIYNIGCMVGAMTTGVFADACGCKRTISLASLAFIIGPLIQAGFYTIAQIGVGRWILGLGVGAYSAGVSPAELRGRIVGIEIMIPRFDEMVVFRLVDLCCRDLPNFPTSNALCTASPWMSNFVVAQVSPTGSATGYGIYVLFAIICIIAFLFVRYALVETKGRSLEERAELFGVDGNEKGQVARFSKRR
ncbi:uncharacterized protein GGS22DRAFT_183149 [Annulohypoxylon maeteangense]|uniref:uncharacterized protein n=1 Tax=Annulohypoxylon maeteangense TaxID=1927788 RepID=UPI0020082DC7|nr:uncharacterized protein GGS22DRAFT_183149 [Annulohypoxylon maeteangense]KAI0889806.1 hypothetical protein GGS22DRAFT_183149 [Annulohypoxylon maeteangense]